MTAFSDDEAKQRAEYDLRWKVALGIGVDERPFANSTLQEFRAQLVLHAEQRAIFCRSLELAKRQGRFPGKSKLKIALDTSNILGRGAVKDTTTCWPMASCWCCGCWLSSREQRWPSGPRRRAWHAT